ncbi:RICIN domain-containing protein [Marinoscillum sp. MHG1-6]|uniref:rhamnogalacturonan lyase family protein n=1 Tax=Marinoscillum sp. MHG1-6 TaxID=2959627 RepID=UPI00280BBB16|nr:RICIN domain-containing protein [Marinoscillum sp. MHG1-6]
MRKIFAAFTLMILSLIPGYSQRVMEDLDRALVVVDQGGSGVYASWRMLGTDPDEVTFNLYRNDVLVNGSPITTSTNYQFVPSSPSPGDQYKVVALVNDSPIDTSKVVEPWADFYQLIPLTPPTGGTTPDGVSYTYDANDASVGDLDNDGDYEIVLKWYPTNSKDNSQSGYTGNTILEALEFDGTSLWKIDLGKNIRSGAHYTQFMVYDLDSDGFAEIACKTADGTVDGKGNVIGDAGADYRNTAGYVLDGPEFLTVFSGQTGEELVTTDYYPARGNVSAWGDGYGNRVDRFLATIAYLDGQRPSLVMCRGYYTRTVLAAYDYRGGELTTRWIFDTDIAYSDYTGQGAHSISVGDVDNDGKDEILYGAAAIDDDGSGLYNTLMGHGDATHLADIDPDEGGLEFYMPHESSLGTEARPNMSIRNAGTGEMQWVHAGGGGDVGRGVAQDLDPNYPGYEVWSSDGSGVYDKDGNLITTTYPQSTSGGNTPSFNFGIWWDEDLQREVLDRGVLNEWVPGSFASNRLETLYLIEGASTNNGTKNTPTLMGDLIGDWREEILMRTPSSSALVFFVSTDVTNYRIRTLMHDPQYRLAIAWQNVGYNQPPHPSFYLGEGMVTPPKPDIRSADPCLSSLKTLPFGEYTSTQLAAEGVSLDDITGLDLPAGSSLILFDQDNFEGSSKSVRGEGSCDVSQPAGSYLSAILVSQLFGSDLTYSIKSKANGQLLTVEGALKDNGSAITLGTDDVNNAVDGTNQVWSFEKYLGDYLIKGFQSRSYIEVTAGLDVELDNTQPGTDEQLFEMVLDATDPAYFSIKNKASGKCLALNPADGSLICETCAEGDDNQLFYEQVRWAERVCQTVPAGSYSQSELTSAEVDLGDILDLDLPVGTSLILFTEDDFQGTSIIMRGKGCGYTNQPAGTYTSAIFTEGILGENVQYAIKSRYNNKRLTVAGGSFEQGSLVILESEANGDPSVDGNNQIWTVERSSGNYLVRALHSRALLDLDVEKNLIQGTSTASGATNEFEVVLSDSEPTYFALKSNSNGQCLALIGGAGEIGCVPCNLNDRKQLFYEVVRWSSSVLDAEQVDLHGKLYPNPTKSIIYFDLNEVKRVEIYSLTGHQLLSRDMMNQQHVDISGLESGVYLIRITTGNGIMSGKIVKD